MHFLLLTAVMIMKGLGDDNVGDRLIKEVFVGYQPNVRPLCDPYPFTVVPDLGIALRQLIDLDDPEQKLTTSIWFRLRWHDCRLMWNVSRYENLSRIVVPKQRMWVPDLTLYENAESKLGDMDKYFVSVNHVGHIEYNLPAIVKSMCNLDVAMFPFDSQTCHLTLGSWIYRSEEVNFTARKTDPADLNSYIQHGGWDLYNLEVGDRVVQGFDGFDYSQVVFTFYLQRQSLFHVVNLILPSFIVKSLAIIGFLLPPESGEKLDLEITILLSLLVFQLVILNTMPNSSKHLPVIAIYFLLSMVLIAMSCVGTVVILNLHFNKHHTPLPRCLRKIVTGCVGKVFRVSKPMSQTEEKLQRLRKEYKKNQNDTIELLHNGSEIFRNNLSRFNSHVRQGTQTGSKDGDANYGFHNNYAYDNYGDTNSRHQTYPVPSQSGSGPMPSVFSVDAPGVQQNGHEMQSKENAAFGASSKICAHLEAKSRGDVKIQIGELVEMEWKLFAVFLDRFFMFLFLWLGIFTGLIVFSFM